VGAAEGEEARVGVGEGVRAVERPRDAKTFSEKEMMLWALERMVGTDR
jgi:hypothetical protein